MRPHEYKTESAQRTAYSSLRDAGKLQGTIKDALRKRRERTERAPQPDLRTPIERLRDAKALVRLGDAEDEYATRAREQNRRRKNWNAPKPTTNPKISFTVKENNEGRYSSRCTYTHYTYTPIVHSAALIVSPTLILFRLCDNLYRIKAPRGYHWKKAHGYLWITKNNDPELTYATDAAELSNWNPGVTLARLTMSNEYILKEREARADERRQKRAERARQQGKRQIAGKLEPATCAATTETARQPEETREATPAIGNETRRIIPAI